MDRETQEVKTMTKIRRRSFLALAASLAAAPGVAFENRSVALAQDKVTLNFWAGFTGGDRPTYEALIAQFNQEHPAIEVKMDIQPWDTLAQKLPAAFATGTGPDIATPDYNVATIRQYARAGTILPLDDAYGAGAGKVETAAMPAAVLDGFTVDGKLYAVPANFATLMLYYNKDLLSQAGVANPPATMDDFRAAAAKLTKKDGSGKTSQYGLAIADHQTIAMWPILIWADGGDILDAKACSALDSPATIAAVKSWADLIVGQGISPVGETGQGADNLFAAGKAAMEMNGPWAAGQYKTAGVNFDVAPIPVGSAGPVTLASTTPMVVSRSTEHKAEVYEFLAWWTGQGAQKALALGSGFPPVRTDMGADPDLAKNPFLLKFAAAAPYARFYLPKADKFTQIDTDVISPAIGRITRGDAASAVLASAAQDLNKLVGC